MFLKNRNIISKMKRSKVTDYAALSLVDREKKIEYLSLAKCCSKVVLVGKKVQFRQELWQLSSLGSQPDGPFNVVEFFTAYK